MPDTAVKVSLLVRGKHSTDSHTLLRLWVYLVEIIYGQKIKERQKHSLFYLINNVLIQKFNNYNLNA